MGTMGVLLHNQHLKYEMGVDKYAPAEDHEVLLGF